MRKRISITLKEELIRRIDALSGAGKGDANRSRTIEALIEKHLISEAFPAVILVGDDKPLEEVGGRPIITNIIAFLRKKGVTKATICTLTELTGKIKEILSGVSGIGITYVEQKERNGTASALRKLKGKIEEDFLLIYGDNFFEFDLGEFIDFHMNTNSLGTAALTTVDKPTRFGVVGLSGRKVTSFNEKPKEAESHLVSVGIFAFKREIFSKIPDSAKSLERDVFPELTREGLLSGCVLPGKWTYK